MTTETKIICDICNKEVFTSILSKYYRIERHRLLDFRNNYDIDVCDICMSKIIGKIENKK